MKVLLILLVLAVIIKFYGQVRKLGQQKKVMVSVLAVILIKNNIVLLESGCRSFFKLNR